LNTYEFISSLVKSLAWPIVVLTIGIMLKRPLSKILSNLNKLTYNNLEMDFSEKLEEIQSTLDDKGVPAVQGHNGKEQEIKTIAEVSPAAAITMSWSTIEQEILATIKRLRISPDYPMYNSPLKNINLLKDANLIDLGTEKTLNELRILRNKAVHPHPSNENITYMEAMKYYDLSRKIIRLLRNITTN